MPLLRLEMFILLRIYLLTEYPPHALINNHFILALMLLLFLLRGQVVLIHQILKLVDHVLNLVQILIVFPSLVIRCKAFPEYLVLQLSFALPPPCHHLHLILPLSFH